MSETTNEFPANSVVRIPDLDTPIYRILPVWHLEEAVRLRRTVLVPPRRWEDPFEIVGSAIAVDSFDGERMHQEIVNQTLPSAYAQCWSRTEESDTLLRAYSRVIKDPHIGRNICPRDEGAQVKSTPRKLLRALLRGTPDTQPGHWYIGAVQYLSRANLLQEIANAIGAHGKRVFYAPENHAKLLLLKREAFSHESEVRAIFVQRDDAPALDLFPIPIDINEVFEEITFDPRLQIDERKEREAALTALGYKGSFGKSELYGGRTILQVVLPRPPAS